MSATTIMYHFPWMENIGSVTEDVGSGGVSRYYSWDKSPSRSHPVELNAVLQERGRGYGIPC
jgi:hypothetical protein